MAEVRFQTSPVFTTSLADVNSSLLEGYRVAFAASLGVDTGRVTVSVLVANARRRLLSAGGYSIVLAVTVRVLDYEQGTAVITFVMEQASLNRMTRAARLPDLLYVTDSVVYAPRPGPTHAPGTTTAPDRWEQGGSSRRRSVGWGPLMFLIAAMMLY